MQQCKSFRCGYKRNLNGASGSTQDWKLLHSSGFSSIRMGVRSETVSRKKKFTVSSQSQKEDEIGKKQKN